MADERFNQTPVRLTDRRFIEPHELTLADDGVKTIEAYGRYFFVNESSAKFLMSVNGSKYFPISMGQGFDLSDSDRFNKLTFKRPAGWPDEITADIITSDCHIFDARLSIVRGRMTPFMQAESVWTPHSATIAAGTALDLTGAHPTDDRYLRKATIVTNMDPAVDLEILNSADAVLDTVFFRSTKLYEVSQGIKVKNNSGAPVVCRASQAWYVVDQ